MRGVRVVIETHSAVLLQGIMTLIAEEKLESEQVMLHWFQRDEEGKTEITSVEPDENGAYGDWPEDSWKPKWQYKDVIWMPLPNEN